MKIKLQTKLLISILSATIFVYLVAFGLIIYNININTTNNAVNQTDYLSLQSAKYFEEILNKDVAILRTLKNTFSGFNKLPEHRRLQLQDEILRNIMNETTQFSSLALNWEIYAIDTGYHKPYGRFRYLYYWLDGRLVSKIDTLDINGGKINSLYENIKIGKKEVITKVYYDRYTESAEDILMSSIAVPIINNDRYEGLMTCDITLSRFNQMISEIKPLKATKTFLITNEGNFVTFFNEQFITKSVTKYYKKEDEKYNILENVKKGKPISFFTTDSLNREHYVTFKPIDIGGFNTPWSFCISIPLDIIKQQANRLMWISVIVGFIGLIFISFVIWIIARNITKPLFNTSQIIKELSEGNISNTLKVSDLSKDEIGEIGSSLNLLIDGLIQTANFAKSIGTGNLNAKFEILSKKDVLGNSLLEMRKSLKIAQIENKKRKKEEDIQTWITQGETNFATILREHNQDLNELSYQIISNLVKYSEANQGGLFIINDNDKENQYIELVASYAYDRRKILTKKIQMGVGLIGRAIQESETIYMTDVPNNYVNITSGLGERNPKSLLIVPLKFNEVIYAVVELASFSDFKPYIRRFIEKIGVSIASTIGTVKITVQTSTLVKELTKQSQELAAQEEEMRQNMEEMQATQEETTKKIFELENFVNAINIVSLVAEFNLDGKLISINDNYVNLLGISRSELIGKFQGSYSVSKERIKNHFEIWEKIKNGEVIKLIQEIQIEEKIIKINEVYSPVYDEFGEIIKILNISIQI